MRRQYQKSWHGIDFDEIKTSSVNEIADIYFYDCFYEEFFKKFLSYDDIPKSYVEQKSTVVDFLSNKISNSKEVLSIGCGVGIVEKLLIDRLTDQTKITGVEPSNSALKWLKSEDRINVLHGYFPDALEKSKPIFDFGYARAIEYIFDQEQYVAFLRAVLDYGFKEFTVLSVSPDRTSFEFVTKELIKDILAKMWLYNKGKFWGYLRTEKDHRDAFNKAGFTDIVIENIDYSTNAITGRVRS